MKKFFFAPTFARSLLPVALALATATAAKADTYPSKLVRIVIPAAAGGSLDITTRLFAQKMGEKLGQSIIVENRPGGETLLGTRMVKDAPRDGYTLIAQASGFTLFPLMRSDAGYDALNDFKPIGIMLRAPRLVVVSSEKSMRNLADLVAEAKTKKLNFGTGGIGTPSHTSAEIFSQVVGVQMTNIPFKGTGAALPDVAAGRVDVMFDAISSSRPYLQSGKLKALAVSSEKRTAALPDVPTALEQGINYTNYIWLGLLAPAGTPEGVIKQLSEAMRSASADPQLRERFLAEGSDPSFVTPEDFGAYLKKEAAEMLTLSKTLPHQ